MMTVGRLLARAKSRGIGLEVAYDSLIDGFKRGYTSYPRTNGRHHPPLIVDPSIKNPIVRELVFDTTDTIVVDMLQGEREYAARISGADEIFLSEQIGIVSPASMTNTLSLAYKGKKVGKPTMDSFRAKEEEEKPKINIVTKIADFIREHIKLPKFIIPIQGLNVLELITATIAKKATEDRNVKNEGNFRN